MIVDRLRSLVVLVVLALPAAADPTNRNLIPFGERAAMLGNAGITSAVGEAVFYNPANLGRIRDPQLSVSGSMYRLSVDPIFVLAGEDQPFADRARRVLHARHPRHVRARQRSTAQGRRERAVVRWLAERVVPPVIPMGR